MTEVPPGDVWGGEGDTRPHWIGAHQLAQWQALARTTDTRTKIRRSAKLMNIGTVLLAGGLCLYLIAIPVAIGLLIWFWIARIDHYEIFFGAIAIVGVAGIGGLLKAIAGSRLRRAIFADGYHSAGVVDEITSREGRDDNGSAEDRYTLVVAAEIGDGHAIRRHIYWGADARVSEDAWLGRSIRFRHNTLDPDDLTDAHFEGWSDEAERTHP